MAPPTLRMAFLYSIGLLQAFYPFVKELEAVYWLQEYMLYSVTLLRASMTGWLVWKP